MNRLKIGMAGFGTVGGGVWHHLQRNVGLLQQRTGASLEIQRIAVRDASKIRSSTVPPSIITTRWQDLVEDPNLDVIVELMGGVSEPEALVRAALESGKHVVTANKALLCAKGEELFRLAHDKGRQLLFEASVAGGIPIIKALREGLVANRITSLHGIINGTCNYILTRMSENGEDYAAVLVDAKKLGYAEADESLDVDGHDAAHKACVLAALAYGFWVPEAKLYTEGIRNVQKQDMTYAHKLGYEIKLLAIIKADPEGAVEVQVQPTLIPRGHVLASVSGVFNAIAVHGDIVGNALFYGRGAGADATASAVLGDLAELASGRLGAGSSPAGCHAADGVRLKDIGEVVSRHYLRLTVADRPGVLASVATILGSHSIGISSVIQPEGSDTEYVPLVIMVHDASEKKMRQALAEIEKLEVIREPGIRMRVEDFS